MKNKIYYGDNLDVLRRYIKDESVDLCYIDPPFNSKRNYNQIYNNVGKEDSAQAQAFIDTWTWDDIATQGLAEIKSNYNGVFTEQSIDLITGLEKVLKKGALLAYLVSMTLRIAEIHRVLKPTGSFYFHCDPTASHYLKLVLDAIFCAKGGQYLNEIIWCYRGGGSSKTDFGKRHDVIFRYSKGKDYKFNSDKIRIPYQAEGIGRKDDAMWGKHKGTDKVYKPHPLGKVPEDWWTINVLNSNDPERLGYPTQKPEQLLERIIEASSNDGDIILDAYCGCGTTVAVANRLNRQWIGIDITYQSISLILKRLTEHDKSLLDNIEINGVPKDSDSAIALANKSDDRTRKEFEKWIVLTYSNNYAMINEKERW
jgi:site-specific DNA-methyltransferase (adenine-specific)